MAESQTPQVPAGYMRDGQGRLVPTELVKPIDLARDELVQQIVTGARAMSRGLGEFKKSAFADIQAFVELSAEQYGARVGGIKGNVTLVSFDGRFKVLRAYQDNITFDERLQAAKALIDDYLHDKTKSSDPEIRGLIDLAFQVNKAGELNTGRVLSLRRANIKDRRWKQAMEAISESIQVVGSKGYIRVYERVGDSDQYEPISLDIATA